MGIKILQLFLFFAGGVIISYVINRLLLSFSQSLGIRNKNDVVIRWSNESKPSLGGVSFFMVFIFSAIFYSILFYDENIFHNLRYIGFIAGGFIAFLMGLADDAYNTKPYLKLIAQIACGLSLVLSDSIIDLTHIYSIDAVFTVLWVIVLMNSLNMLDNMDGITGTTVFFILISCLIVNWYLLDVNTNVWSITLVSLIGAVLGFLFLNVHPSKLFMGDAGSQFIGFAVAYFCIPNLWNVGELQVTQYPSWTGFILCLTVLTPAAVDTLTVVINRVKRGQSPMVGGKDHTTHHLVYAGKNDKQVWVIFTLIGFGATLLSLAIVILMKQNQLIYIPLFLIYFIVVFIALYKNTIKYKSSK
jgi:UDP-GlcNAc:undecaprenyl-phosphate GlcNAc-1-phosphate transferase